MRYFMKASILAYFSFFISIAVVQEINNQNLPTNREKDIDIEYDGAGLTEIKVKGNNLDYIWHTLKDETKPSIQSLEAYNRYERHIKLTPQQLGEFVRWIEEYRIIEMKNTIVKRETNNYGSAFHYYLKVAYNEKQQAFIWDGDDEVSPELLEATDSFLRICNTIKNTSAQRAVIETDKPGLEFIIKSDKWSYLLGEPIALEILLKNKTQHPIELCKFYADIDRVGRRSNFEFQVFRNESKIVQQYIHPELLGKEFFAFKTRHQIESGETVVFKATLNKWYDFPVGDYSIVCTYLSPCSYSQEFVPFEVPPLFGSFTSNTIKIRVFEYESPQK